MNCLAIDYGKKNIGLAFSINGIISPMNAIKNDSNLIENLKLIIDQYKIDKLFVGISQDRSGFNTKTFMEKLKNMLDLTVEGVEETVSTIEATQIFKENKNNKKNLTGKIDSISAAVILNRALGQY